MRPARHRRLRTETAIYKALAISIDPELREDRGEMYRRSRVKPVISLPLCCPKNLP
jgi:hypothetical protein